MANRTYDLIVLIDADAPSDTRAKIVSDATALINQHGDVKQTKDWGLRQTPYRIDHHEEATYHVFQFETDPQAIGALDRSLKLTEGVLRFRLYQSEPGDLPDSPPEFKREERAYERPPANVAATENIEEAAPAPPAPEPAAPEPAAEAASGDEAPAEPEAAPGDEA
jgi:small subunit ribosomal protein S6